MPRGDQKSQLLDSNQFECLNGERFTALLNTDSILVLVLDRRGRITLFSKGCEAVAGYKSEEVAGKSFAARLVPKAQRTAVRKQIRAIVTNCAPMRYSADLVTRTEGQRTIEWVCTPLTDDKGSVREILSIGYDITEKIRAEEVLRNISEQSTQGFLIFQNTRIAFCNSRFAEILGYTVAELLNLPRRELSELIHPEDRQWVGKRWEARLAGKEAPTEYELRFLRKDGTTRWAKVFVGSIVYHGQPALQEWITDITEEKQAEEALQTSEERLRRAQQIAHLGFWDWDVVTGDLFWSDETFRMFGFTPQEFIPTYEKFMAIIHPADRDMVQRHIEAGLDDEGKYDIVFRFTLPSGEVRYLSSQGDVTFGVDGDPVRFVGVQLDITERKLADAALQESEAQYRSLVEHSLQGIIITQDRPYSIVFVNEALVKMLGYTSDELTSFSPSEVLRLVHPEDHSIVLQQLRNRTAGESIQEQNELRWLRKDGTMIWVESWSHPILYGGQPAVQSTLIDITARKQEEERFRRENEINNALLELSNEILKPSASIASIARTVLECGKRLTGSEHGFVQSLDPVTGNAVGHTSTEMMLQGQCQVSMDGEPLIFPRGADGRFPGLWGYAMNTLQPFYTNAPDEHPASAGAPKGHTPIKGFLSVPAKLGGLVLGQIALANPNQDYTEQDLVVVQRLTYRFAVALSGIRSAQALKASETKWRSLVENAPDVILMVDRDGVIQFVNRSAVGIPLEEISGKSIYEFIPPEFHDVQQASLELAFQKGEPSSHEVVGPGPDDTTAWYRVRVGPVIQDQQVVAAIFMIQDVTAQKKAEEALQQALTESRIIFDTVGEAMRVVDADFNTIQVNQRFSNLSGWSEDDLVGQKCYEAFPGPYCHTPDCTLQRVIDGEAYIEIEADKRTKNGAIIPCSFITTALYSVDGKLKGIIESFRDITERKEKEQALLEARARAEFFTDLMAHDLTNIHQGILSLLELTLRESSLSSSSSGYVSKALMQLDRSTDLIDKVKRFSQFDTATHSLETIDLARPFKTAVEAVRGSFPSKELHLKTSIHIDKYFVLADEFLVDVFYNLLHNAMKFDQKEQVRVTVSVRRTGDFLMIQIKDHGAGISDKEKAKIFTRFLEGGEAMWKHGRGIGLTLVQRIITYYDGKIWVEDRVPGDYRQGSCFVFLLPRAEIASD